MQLIVGACQRLQKHRPTGAPGGPCSVFRPGAMHFTLTLTLEPPLSPTTWSSQKSRTLFYL